MAVAAILYFFPTKRNKSAIDWGTFMKFSKNVASHSQK